MISDMAQVLGNDTDATAGYTGYAGRHSRIQVYDPVADISSSAHTMHLSLVAHIRITESRPSAAVQ